MGGETYLMMAYERRTTTWRWRGHWEAWKISRHCDTTQNTAISVHEGGNNRRARDECCIFRLFRIVHIFRLVPPHGRGYLSWRRALTCFLNGAIAVIGVASTFLLHLSTRQQRVSYRRWFVFLDHRKKTVLCLVLFRQKQ